MVEQRLPMTLLHAREDAQLHALQAAVTTVSTARRREELLPRILQASLQLLGADAGEGTNSGALLLLEEDQLRVRAASSPWQDFMDGALPDALQSLAIATLERRVPTTCGSEIFLPICWHDHLHAVLMLARPAAAPPFTPALSIFLQHAAAALESLVIFELAAIDATTRVLSRTFIMQRLYEALKSSFRIGYEVAVLMIDFDNFKSVNDTFGHLTGDRVLREVGRRLHQALRETDIVGRYGGDEFLVVLPNTPVEGGAEVARRIRHAIVSSPMQLDSHALTLDVSIGIAGISGDLPAGAPPCARPSHSDFQLALERILSLADTLMYRAKQAKTTHYEMGVSCTWGSLMQAPSSETSQ